MENGNGCIDTHLLLREHRRKARLIPLQRISVSDQSMLNSRSNCIREFWVGDVNVDRPGVLRQNANTALVEPVRGPLVDIVGGRIETLPSRNA